MRALLFCILLSGSYTVKCQSDSVTVKADSVKKSKKQIYKGPRTASILSIIVPGGGQVYNKKYWKVPIIYAGLGGLGYLFYIHHSDYSYFSDNLAAIYDNDASTENVTPYSTEQLVSLKDGSKKLRDFSLVGVIAVYLLQIMDANVDAHLKTFDVSDDLSIRLDPFHQRIGSGSYAGGISIKLSFH